MTPLTLYTIGFTKKNAETFFEMLKASGAKRIIDVRLNNVSQLAGFAKRQDLAYFLKQICGMDYQHLHTLAPTQEMEDGYKKPKGSWLAYERQFLNLMAERTIERLLSPDDIAGGCLLCSEEKPDQCHRRLVAEYLKHQWGEIEIVHLG